jgi:hypothetical protein
VPAAVAAEVATVLARMTYTERVRAYRSGAFSAHGLEVGAVCLPEAAFDLLSCHASIEPSASNASTLTGREEAMRLRASLEEAGRLEHPTLGFEG